MNIMKKLISNNFRSSRPGGIKYIVIHDTQNPDKNAGIENHFKYHNKPLENPASAHYYVENTNVGQFVLDKDTAYHVGDGKGKYGITNSNSLGIEKCINPEADSTITTETIVKLVQAKMKEYNVPLERVVRHYDASRKPCPGTMEANDWAAWKAFIKRVASAGAPGGGEPSKPLDKTPTVTEPTGTKYGVVTCKVLNVRMGRGTAYKVIGKLQRGDKVKLDRQLGDWWSVYYGDHGGWIASKYIVVQ